MLTRFFLFLLFSFSLEASGKIRIGADRVFEKPFFEKIANKKVALILNHTSLNSEGIWIFDQFKEEENKGNLTLVKIFSPEHGLKGQKYAEGIVKEEQELSGTPLFSLHDQHRRPTSDMLQGVEVIVYDIQDIGSRSYTYVTTLFYVMEEASKHKIPVIVLDRPNPINGVVVDGPLLEEKWRSFVGYINVPYCHGMTVGELAEFFNQEYQVGCSLHVIPMEGWKREMSFKDTGLTWVPTSPQIPDMTSPLYYPMTGILGELSIVNIGVGYTLPFKVVGAPWIDGEMLAKKLNQQNFPGVFFRPFYFRPFFGQFAHHDCQGIYIIIKDAKIFRPVATQYLILGMLKSLYPENFQKALKEAQNRKKMFCQVNGTEEILRILEKERYVVWKLKDFQKNEREEFMKKRKKYLFTEYKNT